jgi:hypothetical protein
LIFDKELLFGSGTIGELFLLVKGYFDRDILALGRSVEAGTG